VNLFWVVILHKLLTILGVNMQTGPGSDYDAKRTTITRQDLAHREEADTRILQKVNAIHRDAFPEKYPRQVEHCLRLVMERLQKSLEKRVGEDPANPASWRISTEELVDLATTAYHLDTIRKGL